MACGSYFELLSARLDGELSPQEERALEEHLISCGECRALAAQLEELHGAWAALDEPAPEGLTGQVMAQVHEEKARQWRTARRRLVRWAAGAAACLAVCVGAWQLAHMPKSDGLVQPMMEEPDVSMGSQARSGPAAYSLDPSASAPAAPAPDPSHYATYGEWTIPLEDDVDTPSAVVLGSVESLKDFAARFPETDLSEVIAGFDDAFFRTRRLLLAVTAPVEGVSLRVACQGLLWEKVTVLYDRDDAWSVWLLLVEVDTMFSDGRVLDVALTDSSQWHMGLTSGADWPPPESTPFPAEQGGG